MLDGAQGGDPDTALAEQVAERAPLEGDEVAAQGQICFRGGGRLVPDTLVGRGLQVVRPGEVLCPQAVGKFLGQRTGFACRSEVIECCGGELEAGLALGVGNGGVLAQA